ncbi:ras-related protein Rab-8B-like isoform X2 [Boleophthalmus pectinirostris]|uniref:ras-related protein Rab-8B-like isoform X2 n=1 Tax=Boleophthalmus pectinirostris TaxID=150288 RepID=UPI00242AF34A|nr:ras-related protein Rab-8B-like isoform X2 [Boleophthalmus pectinirostris]
MAKYDHKFIVLMLGSNCVGKTCLFHRSVDGTFKANSTATIGLDFKNKMFELDGKKILLQIFDTGGYPLHRGIISSMCRYAKGIMLVYDVTSEWSFNSLKDWISFIEEHVPSDADRILLGNKCDPNDRSPRQVCRERGEMLAINCGMRFLEVSAKSGVNVEEAFFTLARDIMTRLNK